MRVFIRDRQDLYRREIKVLEQGWNPHFVFRVPTRKQRLPIRLGGFFSARFAAHRFVGSSLLPTVARPIRLFLLAGHDAAARLDFANDMGEPKSLDLCLHLGCDLVTKR